MMSFDMLTMLSKVEAVSMRRTNAECGVKTVNFALATPHSELEYGA